MNNIKIIYEDNHLIIVLKQANIPVCPDDSKDIDLMSMVKSYLKEKHNKPGNVFLGLIHRLDRPVSGIMVFAKTSKAASRLSEQIRNKQFEKYYYAICNGKTDEKGTLVDYLKKDSKTNITKVSKDGKKSILEYKLVNYKNNFSLVEIKLITGRSHQIRVQFATRNHPLINDNKYNIKPSKGVIGLFSYKIIFYHPITKEKMMFIEPLPNYYPFNIFNKNNTK